MEKINYRVSMLDADKVQSRVIDEDEPAVSMFIGVKEDGIRNFAGGERAGFKTRNAVSNNA